MSKFPALLQTVVEQSVQRFDSRTKGSGRSLELTIQGREDEHNTYLDFTQKGDKSALVLPQARQNEYGNTVIGDRYDRALCPFMVVLEGEPRHIGYHELILLLLTESLEELFPEQGKRPFLDKILWAYFHNRGRLAVNTCQRFLNQRLFNMLPLSGTPLQDHAMNHRLMILDPIFPNLRPDKKLAYQKRKNELLYPWSSIGISDGAAATNNYILQLDLKTLSAFGLRHHNPIRNLYSTLGMQGDEDALVVSRSMAGLEARGIKRGGWNLMTVFLDLPETFEDQILVDVRHRDKTVTYERSFVIFGEETVLEGDTIRMDQILGVNEDSSPVVFDVHCDSAKVVRLTDSSMPFDGKAQPVRIIHVETQHVLKEGAKLTNQHGNKGIIVLGHLGVVHDPIRGEIPIDIIVSARSIHKRKNYGQLLEASVTLIHGNNKRHVIPDELEVSVTQVENALEKAGYSRTGTCPVTTPWGQFNSLCGWVHWGIIKMPEDQLWEAKDVWAENQAGLRARGNKISPIELKSLTTLLGPKSRVVAEILQHQQGVGEVRELLSILGAMKGETNPERPRIKPDSLVYIPSGLGTFHAEQGLVGTISDERMYPEGAYLELPITISWLLPREGEFYKEDVVEGILSPTDLARPDVHALSTNLLPIPHFSLRQPWKHPTGLFGFSDLATQINQILEACDQLQRGEIKATQLSDLVLRYFHAVSQMLSTKTGQISSYLMSVRYPWSSKATAVLGGRNLAANWIEIHQDMAEDLQVESGDYVLVERFPCLGFMSTRIQRVQVTDDPDCKYVIRVSGNSLVSMNLDFDGDVLYVMSFRTEGAKEELKKNFHQPHPQVAEVLEAMNARKVPITKDCTLQEIGLRTFQPLSPKEHAELNATSLAVKLWTGPVIALCYNMMRIVEGNVPYEDRSAHINIEVFLDKVGNSVFSQKHGVRSLREECIEAVCTANSDAMVQLGFPREESDRLCRIIQAKAAEIGVAGQAALLAHFRRHVEEGRSNIINTIVRKQHRAYFATRANLHPLQLVECLTEAPHDLVGHLIHRSLR